MDDDAGRGSRGPRPTLTPELATAVKRTWGLDLEHVVPLGGSTGLNLLVDMPSGGAVVRIHRRHVTEARVEAMQLAREAAARAGVPTAHAIVGRDGERHVTVESSVVEVEHFVESDAKMDTLGRLRQAMPMLARLHDSLASADLPEAADDLRFGNYVPADELAARTADGAHRLRALDASLQPLAEMAERLADDVAEAQGHAPPLENQWCHGDYWDNNVLLGDDDIVLVADFGFMNRRPRIDDLALTLYFTLCDLDAAGHSDPAGTLATLTQAYDLGAQRRLSDHEREALPVALARQPLWSIARWAAELDHPDAVRAHLRGHQTALERAGTILADLDRWREAFRR
jgi:homoserine kinase type II